jgi:glucose-1-phosphate cytidylyltransferase
VRGKGTRLREETGVRPKPMVEIGGRPILWHIMKIYAHHGLRRLRDLPRLQGAPDQALLPASTCGMSDVTFDLEPAPSMQRRQTTPAPRTGG